jgi:hypothetical protein
LRPSCRHAGSSSRAVHRSFRVLLAQVVSPYWFGAPLPGLGLTTDLRGLPTRPAGAPRLRLDSPSSLGLGSAPEYDPDDSCLRPEGERLALLGFRAPIAPLTADSDWYRAYLTRLRCVFRFSQPLGALFRPRPSRPCFMPVALLGFPLQRFLLRRARRASRRPCPSWHSIR